MNDVRPVQAGQAEEDRREGAVAGVEPDVQVLDDLGQQEGEPHDEREHHPGEERRSAARA